MSNKKYRHNKKRNTAFLYEALISEYTKTIVSEGEDSRRGQFILSLIKRHFGKGTTLGKELRVFQELLGFRGEKIILERAISVAKGRRDKLDDKEIWDAQGKLISTINKRLGPAVFQNFLEDYERIARRS